ncbi:putative LRR receptor-like serine/threonine-protein kinase [Hibiscus syriacus]|uniref:non-specific serine/threonine protein kinase n=1 Tax=Hibiscus syriacus TaxID=106335 RepID=A0A6A3AQ36_HIBSY|nr:putative LRR receptor-like serine/threonine-protein kinase [Hibiscus syriacus]
MGRADLTTPKLLLFVNISCLIALVRFTSCGLDAATPPLHPQEGNEGTESNREEGLGFWGWIHALTKGIGSYREMMILVLPAVWMANGRVCSRVQVQTVALGFLTATNISAALPPEFSKFRNLKLLDLNRNYFTGSIPQEWATMKLETLPLMGNRLSGPFPKVLTSITTLTNLSIEGNNFSVSIPPEIGKLINLQSLHLSSNAFTGELPVELAKLVNLTDMHIQGSSLEGPIPSSISVLTSLSDLRISDLKGGGSLFPPLHNLHSLKTLILRNCLLNGEIPEYIGDMKKLKTLDLSYNNLSGEIPESFHKLTKADFMYLTGNRLIGSVPGWILERNKNADVSYNNFTWEATSPIECPRGSVNLVESYSKEANESQYKYSLHINCGGKELNISGGGKYEADREPRGASMFYLGQHWALSSIGNFMDNDIDADNYLVTNTSALSNVSAVHSELYTTVRISPLSLTYYGLCIMKGNYTLLCTLRKSFSRTIDRITTLGNGVLVLKDFNIQEAAGGAGDYRHPVEGDVWPSYFSHISGSKFSTAECHWQKESSRRDSGGWDSFCSIVFALIILGIFWRRGWLGGQDSAEKELRGLDLQTGIFSLRQIKAATKNFAAENKIGEGGFGSVYRGLLSDGTIIAVKQLSSKSKQGNLEFVTEIGMISALQHPNLVKLYGCCVEGNQLLLVYEYIENNCLSRALFGKDATLKLKLDWPTRQKIFLDIARGLAYLHEESRIKIVHRDIKTSNVLLDKNLNAKISDFGLAKLNEDDETHISTRIAGTIGYMAPEYAMRGYLTNKANVYSFSVVALEIVSGKSNTNYRPNEEFVYLLDWRGSLLELVDPDLGSEYSSEEAMVMLNVALLCTNASPTLRPTMSKVVSLLEGRTSVEDLLSDLAFSSINSKFKALVNHFWQNPSQTISLSSNGPDTDSISSNVEAEERNRLLSLGVNDVQSQI